MTSDSTAQIRTVMFTSAIAGFVLSALCLAVKNLGGYSNYVAYLLICIALLVVFYRFRIVRKWQIVIFSFLTLHSISPAGYWLIFSDKQFLLAVAMALAFPLIFALYYFIFNVWKFDETLKLVVGVAIITAMSFGGTFLVQSTADTAYEREQTAKFEQADYDYYVPSSLPSGYKVHTLLPSYDANPAAYTEVSYIYGTNEIGDPSPFDLYLFKKSDKFNPPTDCGPEYPNNILSYAFPCEAIGMLNTGETVYHHDSDFSNTYNTYVQIGDTMVVLHENSIDRDNGGRLEIMRSLHKVSATELQALHD